MVRKVISTLQTSKIGANHGMVAIQIIGVLSNKNPLRFHFLTKPESK